MWVCGYMVDIKPVQGPATQGRGGDKKRARERARTRGRCLVPGWCQRKAREMERRQQRPVLRLSASSRVSKDLDRQGGDVSRQDPPAAGVQLLATLVAGSLCLWAGSSKNVSLASESDRVRERVTAA